MKIKYKDLRMGDALLDMVDKVNEIVVEYQAQGFRLTLRQIYYKFVARDLFPDDRRWRRVEETNKWVRDPNGKKNAEPNYKWLGGIVNDGRLAGLIDWSAVEDRTRELQSLSRWTSPGEIVAATAQQFHVDLWEGQVFRPEVWIEKDALAGIVQRVCNELDVSFFACRGYTSQSGMWEAAMRLKKIAKTQKPVIFHFGDHDPSGKDMTRDISDRLEMFMGGIELHRLALTMDQVQEYECPPDPAPVRDSRCRAYVAEFGDEAWELDALEPRVIEGLIRENVRRFMISPHQFARQLRKRDLGRKRLGAVAKHWQEVEEFVSKKG